MELIWMMELQINLNKNNTTKSEAGTDAQHLRLSKNTVF
jgi:hypothetical protein